MKGDAKRMARIFREGTTKKQKENMRWHVEQKTPILCSKREFLFRGFA